MRSSGTFIEICAPSPPMKVSARNKSGDQDADRIEPPEKGDDDGGEAVARGYARIEMADRPRHFDNAGKAGERA